MKFDAPARETTIDREAVLGKEHPQVEGMLKTTGTALYAAEHHDVGSKLLMVMCWAPQSARDA